MSFADKKPKNPMIQEPKTKEETQMPARPVRKTSEAPQQPVTTAKPAESKEATQSATIFAQSLPKEINGHLCSLRDELAEIKVKAVKAASECDELIKAINKLVEDVNSKPAVTSDLDKVFVFVDKETGAKKCTPKAEVAFKHGHSVDQADMCYE